MGFRWLVWKETSVVWGSYPGPASGPESDDTPNTATVTVEAVNGWNTHTYTGAVFHLDSARDIQDLLVHLSATSLPADPSFPCRSLLLVGRSPLITARSIKRLPRTVQLNLDNRHVEQPSRKACLGGL